MPFVCHSFGFLKMCPNVLMGLKAVLMLALPKTLLIRSDTPWTYGMVVKVFRWLPLSCLSTADFLGDIHTYGVHTYIQTFPGAPPGAFQQPVYNKFKVRWLRILARPLKAVHSGYLSET